jgi:hypothetical protein
VSALVLRVGSVQFKVASVEDASRVYCAERDRWGLGASEFPTGKLGALRVSYNGKVWRSAECIFDPFASEVRAGGVS